MNNVSIKTLLISCVLLFSALNNSAAGQSSQAVDACVDKKVTELRKQIGQETPINFDVLEEFTKDCAVSKPTQLAGGTVGGTQNIQNGDSSYSWVMWLVALGGIIFLMKSKFGSNLMDSLRGMENRSNQKKKEKQDAKNEAIVKKISLKANPGMSEAAYDAKRAAEVAAKNAKKQEELDMKAADNAHWEGIAAGTIPVGTPPPSQVAYEALPLEVRLQMEANEQALLIAQHNAEKARQHNAMVDKTVNDLRNAEMFNTGQAEYLRQQLDALKAKQ